MATKIEQVVQARAVRQTTQNHISPLFYVSICQSMYQMSQKCKIDTLFNVSNHFFLNWRFSWEFGKEIFSQNWKEEWSKEIHCSKKILLFKTQVISFLNLKHIIESIGVSVMLNLVFYVFKGKQLQWIQLLISIHQRFLISSVTLLGFYFKEWIFFKSSKGNNIISKNVNILCKYYPLKLFLLYKFF